MSCHGVTSTFRLAVFGIIPFTHKQQLCLEIIEILLNYETSVLSAIINGSGKVLVLGGKSLMYLINSKVPRIYSLGTPCFIVLQSEKNV